MHVRRNLLLRAVMMSCFCFKFFLTEQRRRAREKVNEKREKHVANYLISFENVNWRFDYDYCCYSVCYARALSLSLMHVHSLNVHSAAIDYRWQRKCVSHIWRRRRKKMEPQRRCVCVCMYTMTPNRLLLNQVTWFKVMSRGKRSIDWFMIECCCFDHNGANFGLFGRCRSNCVLVCWCCCCGRCTKPLENDNKRQRWTASERGNRAAQCDCDKDRLKRNKAQHNSITLSVRRTLGLWTTRKMPFFRCNTNLRHRLILMRRSFSYISCRFAFASICFVPIWLYLSHVWIFFAFYFNSKLHRSR